MNKPHKYAEVIKAWADGADIEWQDKSGKWRCGCITITGFDSGIKWRVKPLPPKEPDYATIAQAAYFARQPFTRENSWKDAVNAALKAKDEYEVALKAYNENL